MVNMNIKLKKKKKIQNTKLIYCSSFIWKKIFLIQKSFVFKLAEKKIYTRSSCVPRIFSNSYITIYSGNKWRERVSNRWMVGFKFGEFTWNRKLALYKAKQMRKKKKK